MESKSMVWTSTTPTDARPPAVRTPLPSNSSRARTRFRTSRLKSPSAVLKITSLILALLGLLMGAVSYQGPWIGETGFCCSDYIAGSRTFAMVVDSCGAIYSLIWLGLFLFRVQMWMKMELGLGGIMALLLLIGGFLMAPYSTPDEWIIWMATVLGQWRLHQIRMRAASAAFCFLAALAFLADIVVKLRQRRALEARGTPPAVYLAAGSHLGKF
ncbi:hypothetical protein BV898_00809 [Hypsibius exemplaris]|uniref:MARVEL domain-containing protein n=1 Tax=Hypsibius exemplaris TaxID=2072580 RepID=A0A1W0XC80_HYPEX|nr:hypothetical protein BV898_00809 [Hypsibius exemplaris]